jgi:hyperosmotically inducible periplasmic protein
MRISTIMLPISASIAMMLGAVGCEQEGPAERAGERIDHAAERAGDKIEQAGDTAAEKIEEAKKGAEDKTGG